MSKENDGKKKFVAFALILIAAVFIGGGLFSTTPTYYTNGDAYIHSENIVLSHAETLVAAKIDANAISDATFKGVPLGNGTFANATGSVTIGIVPHEKACIYSMQKQTQTTIAGTLEMWYPSSIGGQYSLNYDVFVNGEKKLTNNPFDFTENSITMPYNSVLGVSPVIKVVGKDATQGLRDCPSTNFVVVRLTPIIGSPFIHVYDRNSFEVYRTGGVLTQIFGDKVLKSDLMSTDMFNEQQASLTYKTSDIGNAVVQVKVPFSAYNILLYTPASNGVASNIVCSIDKTVDQKATILRGNFTNTGDTSAFNYKVESSDYTFASYQFVTNDDVAKNAKKDFAIMLNTNNVNADKTGSASIKITGESGTMNSAICNGQIVDQEGSNPIIKGAVCGDGVCAETENSANCPNDCKGQPNATKIVGACQNPIPLIQKAVPKTINGIEFLGITWGGTVTTECAYDLPGMSIVMFIIGAGMFVYGDQKKKKDWKEYGVYLALFGIVAFILTSFYESTFLSAFGGNGILILAIILGVGYFALKSKLAALL